jgi:membrane fusion protein (multidrug efflux system)
MKLSRYIVCIIPIGMLLIMSCEEQKEEIVVSNNFPVIELKLDSVHTFIDYVADIEALKNIELRTRTSGYIERIHVDEGQLVKEGQLIFSLSSRRLKNELDKANALYSLAKAECKSVELEMKNIQLLVDKGVLDNIELELAKAKYEAALARREDAAASLSQAQLSLEFTEIKAPFSGFIDRIPFKVGSYVEEGQLLSSLSDISFLHVYFNVSETEYLAISKQKSEHQDVQLILADGTIYNEMGEIETMEGDFEEGTGTIAFRAKFSNSNNLIRHNSTGKIRLKRRFENVFIIPQKSVFEIQDRYFVYALDENNTVSALGFIPLLRFDDYYIVDQYLKGTRIVYEGVQKLKEGMTISPIVLKVKITEIN